MGGQKEPCGRSDGESQYGARGYAPERRHPVTGARSSGREELSGEISRHGENLGPEHTHPSALSRERRAAENGSGQRYCPGQRTVPALPKRSPRASETAWRAWSEDPYFEATWSEEELPTSDMTLPDPRHAAPKRRLEGAAAL